MLFSLYVPQQEDVVRKVGLSRYGRVSRSAFGLNGKKRVAVLRTAGAILGEPYLQHRFTLEQRPVRSLKLLPVVEPKHAQTLRVLEAAWQSEAGRSQLGSGSSIEDMCSHSEVCLKQFVKLLA